jgi:signal peptidase I
MGKQYSFRKSRAILKNVYFWYKKKGESLPLAQRKILEEQMSRLDQAILDKKREESYSTAQQLEQFSEEHCKKSFWHYSWELLLALLFALVIATLVRQVWFELYEIPTGSMRPTFREQDHLTVTKTAFGINFPLQTRHLYFDPTLVQRGSVLIFSGDGLPLPDVDTTFFGIFPYKKRYIKRLIGKPGDAFYFYGGQLYGVDQAGQELTELRDVPWMKTLDYVPFLSFDGQISQVKGQTILFQLFNQPVGKISYNFKGQLQAEVYNGAGWIKDQPLAQAKQHDQIETYSDLFGMRNYAMARLLTKEQLAYLNQPVSDLEEGVLYLQLHHTPSLAYPDPVILTSSGGRVSVTGYSAVIPLRQEHLDAIMKNLYTARFVIEDAKARRYEVGKANFSSASPQFPNMPDGTYEFYFGKASRIHWAGISTTVDASSPLYSRRPENVQKLFNLGIEMSNYFKPQPHIESNFPHRYAYFREGDLYLMGAPVIKKGDQALVNFVERETQREKEATEAKPYVAFKDYGAPLKEGKLDRAFVRRFGITVPEKQYLVLGDNHAMSSDSRVFGFVPQANLQGAPCWIIWPPGERLGPPSQKPYPLINLPRGIVWTCVALILLAWYACHCWQMRRPVVKNKGT